MSAVDSVFPQGAPPVLALRPMICAYDASLRGAYVRLHDDVRAGSVRSTRSLDAKETLPLFTAFPMWGGAILVPVDKLGALDKWSGVVDDKTLRGLRAEAKKGKPFVWMTRRPKAGPLFVLVAPDDAAMNALVGRFAQLTAFHEGATPLTSP
jgi:hypothetical protein